MRACHLLHDVLFDSARRNPHKVAITCGGTSVEYGELARRTTALACSLVAGGVERGDRVLVLADNSIETVIAFWAALIANAVPVILHPQTKPAKLAYVVADS